MSLELITSAVREALSRSTLTEWEVRVARVRLR